VVWAGLQLRDGPPLGVHTFSRSRPLGKRLIVFLQCHQNHQRRALASPVTVRGMGHRERDLCGGVHSANEGANDNKNSGLSTAPSVHPHPGMHGCGSTPSTLVLAHTCTHRHGYIQKPYRHTPTETQTRTETDTKNHACIETLVQMHIQQVPTKLHT